MSIKTLSRVLLGAGIALIFVGVGMDTTVSNGYSTVHNIGLIAKQQNMIFLGGLAFLSGIVLFAISKMKLTNDEEKQKEEAPEKTIGKLNLKILPIFKTWWNGLDRVFLRLGAFILFIFNTAFLAEHLSFFIHVEDFFIRQSYGNKMFIFAIVLVGAYMLTPRPADKIIRNVCYLFLIISTIVGVNSLIVSFSEPDRLYITGARISLLIAVVSLIFIRFMRPNKNN